MAKMQSKKMGRRGTPESWLVDAHVGERIRMRRMLIGMSQEKMAESIGLTFQQVQKYERGANRISAGTLYRLGQTLDVPMSFFFDSFEEPHLGASGPGMIKDRKTSEPPISPREARLLRLWRSAPADVASEVVLLLSAISPVLHDSDDKIEGPVEDDTKPRSAETPVLSNAAAVEAEPSAPEMAEFETAEVEAAEADSPKRRRRHGAVWDPTDIYRGAKPQKETT